MSITIFDDGDDDDDDDDNDDETTRRQVRTVGLINFLKRAAAQHLVESVKATLRRLLDDPVGIVRRTAAAAAVAAQAIHGQCLVHAGEGALRSGPGPGG